MNSNAETHCLSNRPLMCGNTRVLATHLRLHVKNKKNNIYCTYESFITLSKPGLNFMEIYDHLCNSFIGYIYTENNYTTKQQ